MQWQAFLEALNCKLRTGYVLRDIKTKKRCESELMTCILANPDVRHLLLIWLDERYKSKECKSIEKARQLKDLGNKEFQGKNYASSIRLYTKSAQYAPPDSEDLPIAIANRSASLFYTGQYKDCLSDIELAVNLDYPNKLCYKLYLRAAQCYLKLRKKKSGEEALLKVQDIISKCSEISDMKRESIEKEVALLKTIASSIQNETEDEEIHQNSDIRLPETTFGSNPNFPFASAALEQRYTPDKGRYVVTNRDIKKGDILFVEKPFALVLLDFDKPNSLCKHCCHPYGDVPVSCRMCLDTAYCGMKCRNDAWLNYHQWECPGSQMGLSQQIGIADLALKVFLTCSTTLDNERFNEVQKLVTNIEKLSAEDLLVYSITAAMLTLYFWKYTNFFKVVDLKKSLVDKFSDTSLSPNYDISSDNGKQLFVSSLILRHTLQLISNGHAITKLNLTALENDKVATEQQERIATGIYPSVSMMNHSCDPNIINSFWDQYLIVKATKDIPADGEILNCYGPHFRRMSTEDRQEMLKNQYCFTCKCEPCTSPELQYFLEKFSALKCPECSGALQNFHSYSMHCLDCGATPVINYGPDMKLAQELFDAAQICMELEKDTDALDKLKQCLNIRRNILYKYHEDITATLDVIGKVYAIRGRWLDSISYLEHSIVGIEERFGSDSIELANELNKITDICIQYLREETNTGTKQYKNTLKKTRRFLDRAKQIMNLNYGPWNGGYQEIDAKKEQLSVILKNFNI